MFSMTATAPESVQQRRRRLSCENSPRVTPTKHQSPPIPYGQHSPFPIQHTGSSPAGRHVRRYSATEGNLPPMMPLVSWSVPTDGELSPFKEGEQQDETSNVLLPRGIFRATSTDGADESQDPTGASHADLDIEHKCSLLSLEDKRMSDHVPIENAAVLHDTQGILNSALHNQLSTSDSIRDDFSGGNASDDERNEDNAHFDQSITTVECPTEESLRQMEATNHDHTEGEMHAHINKYMRSISMEPLFDDNATEDRSNKRSFLTLKTVDSIDCDDIEESNSPQEMATMSSSYNDEQDFPILTVGRDIESCSSNGVLIDEGAMNGLRSFQRSASMQPIFDRDSSERLSSTDPSAFDENIAASNNNTMASVEEMPTPESPAKMRKRNPTSPIVYTLTDQPSSPLLSDINTEINQEENAIFGRVCVQLTGVSLSHDSASDVGYDTYFDQSVSDIGGDTYFDRNPNDYTTNDLKRCLALAKIANEGKGQDIMQPLALPPRLKRTTTDPGLDEQNSLDFPLSPRKMQPHNTSISPSTTRKLDHHTPSLLDDCSDEEDDLTSFHIVNSPNCHTQSYSCFPKKHTNNRDSSYVSYLNKKQKPNNREHHPVNAAVDHNIQKALLETRHRRWACQSAFAGSHAQSDQVFDISNRVQCIAVCESAWSKNHNRNNDLQIIDDDSSECTDDESVIVLTRMSVSHAAIRAGALACGLWRTVRLVRLPSGLFEKHWLTWKEMRHSFEEVYDQNDVWALLQMLRETFPLLDELYFEGDTVETSNDPNSDDDMRKEWRNEIISRVLQILPNLIAIDGVEVSGRVDDVLYSPHVEFAPVKKKIGVELDSMNTSECPDIKLDGANATYVEDKSSDACAVCEPVNMQICGWTHLVDSQAQNIKETFAFDGTNTVHSGSIEVEAAVSFIAPKHYSVAKDISTDAIKDVSQNILLMVEDGCVSPDYEPEKLRGAESSGILEVGTNLSLAATPVSSNSWDATNKASNNSCRPPKCPKSSTHRRHIPKLSLDKKRSKGFVMKEKFKRRVLGLIPSTSVMDDDDDSDEDDREHIEDDCPTDLL